MVRTLTETNMNGDTRDKTVAKGGSHTNQGKTNSSNSNEHADAIRNVLKSRFYHSLNILKTGGTKFGLATVLWFLGYLNVSLLWLFCGVCVTIFVAEKVRKRNSSSEVVRKSAEDPKEFMETVKEMYRLDEKHVPSWLFYPDVEKAEWLNRIIQKLWPYVGNYFKDVMVEKVQPCIRRSSLLLSNFTFSDVDLGDTPPRVAGIKVYSDKDTRRDEIIMDLQIVYDGDCNIVICMNHLQAGIRKLLLRGLVRIEMRPLVQQLPLVGAIGVSFVKDPVIDFDLTHLANIFDLPGLDELLRGAISDTVRALFVLPERYIVKLCPDVDISKLKYPLPEGVLRIHVIGAKNLAEKDSKLFGLGGGSDPFVTVKVGHAKEFRTKTIDHTVNPTWNESFDIVINQFRFTDIFFNVFDDDGALNPADFLGRTNLPIRAVYERGAIDEMIKLSDIKTGMLHVRLEWFELSENPVDLDEAIKHSAASRSTYSSFLNVYVDGAQNLPANQAESSDPSPVLKIQAPGLDPMKTKVCANTGNPIWDENFQILLHNPTLDEIIFEVEDLELKPGNLGFLKFPVKQLLSAPSMTLEQPFALQNSGPHSVLNLRISLRILKMKPEKPSSGSADGDSSDTNQPPATKITEEAADKRSDAQSGSNSSNSNSGDSIGFKGSSETRSVREENVDGGAKNVNNNRRLVDRAPSIASEMSNLGAVENLRKRVNAKQNKDGDRSEEESGLGKIQLTIKHQRNKLVVMVVKAENLIVCDEDNFTSDPYVRVFVIPDKRHRKKTKVVKNDLNPVFDEKLEFDISHEEAKRKMLNVTVKNQTGFLSSEKVLMGQIIIDLSKVDLLQSATEWYPLKLPSDA